MYATTVQTFVFAVQKICIYSIKYICVVETFCTVQTNTMLWTSKCVKHYIWSLPNLNLTLTLKLLRWAKWDKLARQSILLPGILLSIYGILCGQWILLNANNYFSQKNKKRQDYFTENMWIWKLKERFIFLFWFFPDLLFHFLVSSFTCLILVYLKSYEKVLNKVWRVFQWIKVTFNWTPNVKLLRYWVKLCSKKAFSFQKILLSNWRDLLVGFFF